MSVAILSGNFHEWHLENDKDHEIDSSRRHLLDRSRFAHDLMNDILKIIDIHT